MKERNVVIIGGGIAGISAAESLSRRFPNLQITLLESKRTLGGRAGSYVDAMTNHDVDYCQHVAMGCCTNLIDLLQHAGAESLLRRHRELTFLHPDHPPSRFAPNTKLPAPLHLLSALSALCFLRSSVQREIRRALWRLMRSKEDSLRDITAHDWLVKNGQSRNAIEEFWDVILVSALGEQTQHVSMRAARKVLIDGFAAAHGASDILVPTVPLQQLFGQQVVKTLIERGVTIETSESVQAITPTGKVVTKDNTYQADAVITAVPWHILHRLFLSWPDTSKQHLPDLDRISEIPSSPISGLHLWFDRELTELDHVVMVGTTVQWLFRDPIVRDPIVRDPTERSDSLQHPDLVNETEESSKEVQSHYYQVVISASAKIAQAPREQLIDTVLQELRHAFPNVSDANLLGHRLVTDPNSVFSIRPQVERIRPNSKTSLPWLALAGDWTQTDWPATMESAVISGRRAAESIARHLVPDSALPSAIFPFECAPLAKGLLARLLIR